MSRASFFILLWVLFTESRRNTLPRSLVLALSLSILDLPTSPLDDETGFMDEVSVVLPKAVKIPGALFGIEEKVAPPLAAFFTALVMMLTASWRDEGVLLFVSALSDLFDAVAL